MPLRASAIVLDASSLTAPIIVVDGTSAGAYCLPMDWADRARFVTAS